MAPEVPSAPGARGNGYLLELEQIQKHYGNVVAIKPLDLKVVRGECLTILGPSGCGKTTLLRLVAGFIMPTAGRIVLNGTDVARVAPAQRGIGMVFQHYALFPHMTVAMNVAYGLRMRHWSKKDCDSRVAAMLELVGLAGLGHRLPRELSGGQQQRVALARALAFGPNMLLMDEPLGSLDRDLRFRMAAEIRRIHQELDTTVLYVTHDRDEALAMADRIAIMNAGVIEALDRPRELFMRPGSAFVARFFGGYNLIPAEVVSAGGASAEVVCLGASIEVPAGPAVRAGDAAWLAIPPSAVHLKIVEDASFPLDADVSASSYLGDVIRLTCALPGNVQLLATVPSDEATDLALGNRIRLFVDARKSVVVTDRTSPTAGTP